MKKVIAKSVKGHEYLYSRKDCYAVSAAKAKLVCDTLNRLAWNLKDNETWFIHEIDDFDFKYTNAAFQKLIAGKTGIKIRNYLSVYPGAF